MSTVGADHTDAPAGAESCTPPAFFLVGFGSSGIVKLCHSTFPLASSIATTLPRNVQHGYCALAPGTSSTDDTGTYKRSPAATGAPVIRAYGCFSTFTFHSNSPVWAFNP